MGLTDKHLVWGDDIPSEDEKTYYRQIDNLEKENMELRMALKEDDNLRNSLMAIKAMQKQSCYDEDIAKAFQLGLALGLGEIHNEVDKLIGEIKKSIIPQSCDDTISRQAVLEKAINVPIAKITTDDKVIYRKVIFVDDVEKLPPVKPQQKMGRWIDDKCSKCGKGIEDLISSSEWYRNEEPNFCPFCGIKMEKKSEE